MRYDEIVTLPSGTELSIDAARGDLNRAIDYLNEIHDVTADGLACDLEHVKELLVLVGRHA